MDYDKAAGQSMIVLSYIAGCAFSPFSSFFSISDPRQLLFSLIFTLITGAFFGLIIYVVVSFLFFGAGGRPSKLQIFLTVVLVPVAISFLKVYGARLFD